MQVDRWVYFCYIGSGDIMRLIFLAAFIMFQFFTSIWVVINYRQERKLGIKHKYGILIFNAILWFIIMFIVVSFLCNLGFHDVAY